MEDFLTKKCSRIIRPSKYEHNDPASQIWWTKTFERLEKEFSIPPARRIEVIEELLPSISEKLTDILSFEGLVRPKIITKRMPIMYTRKYVPAPKVEETVKSISTEMDFGPSGKEPNAGPNNPYLRFLKRRPDRSAIWTVLPPLKLEEMNLIQKAEAITETIAVDFYEWLLKLGGDEKPTLDVPTILRMFEIGFNYHAAHSLCVRIKEMPAVTDAIAEARNIPQVSVRVNLHSQLRHDLKANKAKENLVAFGKMLPLELRTMPPKEDFVRKWLDCKRVPKELATMATVWEGIESLRSTRAFCGWLIDHPEIPPPLYLEAKGMLRPDFLLGPHYSVESTGEAVEAAEQKS